MAYMCNTTQKYLKLDDSAFFRTQSSITEICYFEYLYQVRFLDGKNHFSPQFRAI